MSLVAILVMVCVIIFALWLVQTFLPEPWKTPVLVIVVLFALLWIVVQLWPGLAHTRVP